MTPEEFDEAINKAKNRLTEFGFEVTSTSSSVLAMQLGKFVMTDDNFRAASLDDILGALINFITSYLIARQDFRELTHKQREEYMSKFVAMLSIVFTQVERVYTDALEKKLKETVKQANACDHKGTLIDYVLNEEYYYCTKCDTKIKKREYGRNYGR